MEGENLVVGQDEVSQFNQTDFGRIYFNIPTETAEPKTIDELAATLRVCNQRGQKVKIRNTGHSVNGQTLTKEFQISLASLKGAVFDREKLEVVVKAGTSWHEVLRAVEFPKFCLPVFPNNPGQKIHIGGTASVGGIGPYSSKNGGFWNHVKSIKLVTMSGEIIECSKTTNYDLLKYSLGGFGRIGVIAELTVAVVPSRENVVALAFFDPTLEGHFKNLQKALKLNEADGLFTFLQVGDVERLEPFKINPSGMFMIKELEDYHDASKTRWHYATKFLGEVEFSVSEKLGNPEDFDLSFGSKYIKKELLVYYFPQNEEDPAYTDLCHPWSDYAFSGQDYVEFLREAKLVIRRYGMEKFLMREHLLNDSAVIDAVGCYAIRNNKETYYPLSLEIEGEEITYALGVMPTVPPAYVKDALDMVTDLTELCYDLGGKRYLYGIHSLSKEQIEKHFGKDIIAKWAELKAKYDSKHLLNIGVIEHLDV